MGLLKSKIMNKATYLTILLYFLILTPCWAQISGKVYNAEDSQPLAGIEVILKNANIKTITNKQGIFTLSTKSFPDTLIVIGGRNLEKKLPVIRAGEYFDISLEFKSIEIEEVNIETGYQSIPKERATGSFVQISQDLIKQSVSSNIMERLEGVANGLHFNKKNIGENVNGYSAPLIRGVSTINSNNTPLIVVDNFPYDGDISLINPNDIESITFLKDASAASIWGARAGNGVIVIKTKSGKWSQPLQISLNANFSFTEKPDLYYSPKFISPVDFIKQELTWFEKGLYLQNDRTVLSPVIEDKFEGVLNDAEIIDKYKSFDIRDQASNYLYRSAFNRRYAGEISGSSDSHNFRVSAGLDQNMSSLVASENERLTLTTANQFKLWSKFQAFLNLSYIQDKDSKNGMSLSEIRPAGMYPYARLIDDQGNYLSLPQAYRMKYVQSAPENGLLDWEFRPLQEIDASNEKERQTEVRINTGINYSILNNLSFETKFQYNVIRNNRKNIDYQDQYRVRDLVNRFTQPDGRMPFPLGDILREDSYMQQAYSARTQLNYNTNLFNQKHKIYALAGAEIRHTGINAHVLELYGYNDQILTSNQRIDYITRFTTLPNSSAQIPTPTTSLQDKTDRFISYFSNFLYSFENKYIFSASARKDYSNLFGVKTNDKSVPLWSTGLAWDISKESFLENSKFDQLKFRVTYGYAGNIDKSTSSYVIGRYSTDYRSSLPIITIQNPGNPQLKWERVRTFNLGIDFATSSKRLSGSLEYFNKKSTDLIGDKPLDPTSGFFIETNYSNRVNYADLKTYGYDISVNTINTTGKVKWQTDFLFNYVKDKVTKFDFENSTATLYISTYDRIPRLNYPVNGLYSYPWAGLNPENGNPRVLINGELSEDYGAYVNSLQVEDLIYHGSQIPNYMGSINNIIKYQNLSLAFNITFKAGYFFRSNSIDYNSMKTNWSMHKDYLDRWQKPGDELRTDIPSAPNSLSSNRDIVFLRSEVLVEPGDHIRLQDINLNYSLKNLIMERNLPFNSLNVFVYARDLGIIWRANKKNIDPDRPYVNVVNPLSVSLGFNFNF